MGLENRPANAETQRLGTVETRSGSLVLLDFGMLSLWSNDNPPLLPEGVLDEKALERANSFIDLELTGRDALVVNQALDLGAGSGRWIFDQPSESLGDLRGRVATVCREHGWQADIAALPRRMPHAERLRSLLEISPMGDQVQFHGLWAVAAGRIPAGGLPVLGARMDPSGPDAGRWWSVWVACDPDGVPTRSVELGHVLVDEARLMFADPAVLSAYRLGSPPDGLADLAFWGRDAAVAARDLSAGRMGDQADEVFGWVDVPIRQARDLAEELNRIRSRPGRAFAVDFRPHDDQFALMSQIRASAQESGSIDVAGLSACGFMTSWGDGAFPVFADLAADGRLVAIRVELGCDAIVRRTRRVEDLWFGELSLLALVSRRVVGDGAAARWLYREQPDHPTDSGWRVLAGDETDEYKDDPANITMVPLRELIERDPDLEAILRTPAPCAFERTGDSAFVSAPPPDIRD